MGPSARSFQDPSHFRDLGRAVVQLGVFATAVGTGGMLGAALAVGGAGAAAVPWDRVLAKFGELTPQIFGELTAAGLFEKLSRVLSRRWSERDATFANQELSSCMGDAIRECLLELAKDRKRIRSSDDRDALKRLAARVPRLWARIALYPGTARWSADQLRSAIDSSLAAAREAAAGKGNPKTVDADAWALVLGRMVRNAKGVELSASAFDAGAARLEARTGAHFLELLARDAQAGGRRFATGLFASLAELQRELPTAVSTAVAAHLETMEDDARWRHRAVIRRIRKLDEGLRQKLDAVLGKLTPELPLDERERNTATTVSLTKALRAQQRAIPLIGREAELAQLDAWLDGEQPVAVRLVTGLAGTGKTRLAQELCDAARAEGWHAGFLGRADLDAFLGDLTRNWAWEHPTLVVLDYAAARSDQIERFFSLIERQTRARPGARPLRLLLLERHRGTDTGGLSTLLGHLHLASHQSRNDWYSKAEDLELLGFQHRPEVLRQTLAASMALTESEADAAHLERLAITLPALRLEESTPLLLQLAVRFRTQIVDDEIDSLLGLLDKWWSEELKLLRDLASGYGCPMSPLQAMLVLACLRAGLPDDEVELQQLTRAECKRWGLGDAPPGPKLREALTAYLGQDEEQEEPYIARLEPDLMAEFAVLDSFRSKGASKAKRERLLPWLAHHADQRPEQVGAFLIRLCEDLFDAESWRFLRDERWWTSVSPQALQAAERSLPERTIELRELSVSVRRGLLALDDGDEAERARRLNNLSVSLSNLGRGEEALGASEEAVELYRRLAEARPDAFEPDLATSLNNLGNRLSDLGRREEALGASEEAVELLRRLAAARPDAFEPDLAGSLNNLGNRLSNLGRGEEALGASEEAVELLRRLAAARPDAFEPDLAGSLSNLGNRLSNLGRGEEALGASEEAVELYRRLAEARPDAFEPDLAGSLNNLGSDLSNLGRGEEALGASEEAVELYRRLAAARPDAFEPDLAMSLNNLGMRLSNLGRREEALGASEEAVELRRRLAAARPDAFEPALAMSLGAKGSIQIEEDPLSAAASFEEGLRVLLPHFRVAVAAFAGTARALARDMLRACQQAGTEPDAVLLREVAELLGAAEEA